MVGNATFTFISLFRNNSTHNCNCRTPYVSFPQRLFRESIRFVHFYAGLGSLFHLCIVTR